jgi:hypothetical protein
VLEYIKLSGIQRRIMQLGEGNFENKELRRIAKKIQDC